MWSINIWTEREAVQVCERGEMKAVCSRIARAENKGKLEDKATLVSVQEDIRQNLMVKGKMGKRYKLSQQIFYKVILLYLNLC